MPLHITRATPDMADAIAHVGFLSWNAAYAGIVQADFLAAFTPQKRADRLCELLQTRSDEYYAFADGLHTPAGSPLGYAILGAPQLPAPTGAGEVHALYFLPDAWGKGYAAEAMAFCLERLTARGYTHAVLWVLADNRRARRFYEKHGFTPTGEQQSIDLGMPLVEIRYARALPRDA